MIDASTKRWQRVEAILDEALELPAAEVSAYVARVCADDPEIRVEVEALLDADRDAGKFMEAPVEDYAETLFAEIRSEMPDDPLVGRQLGPYRVNQRIGGGGMGVIYEATDSRLDRKVALKLLPLRLSSDPEAKERFVREARAASALDHPNICTVFDIGETDDERAFIVMALYEGQTLADKLRGGRLAIDEALALALQIGSGLARAHGAGIVHRDIKPANVIVTVHDEVKILDFGIAKASDDVGLTGVGNSPGTPSYMSPEQARGDPVDLRTDIWSLAAVLYEMVAGERPFRGGSEGTVFTAIQNDQPEPLEACREDVPEGLAQAVTWALAKDPNARPQSVEALMRELDPQLPAAPDSRELASGRQATAASEASRDGFVVRTLLLTDWVESTKLVEELGDRRLAEISVAHDRIARDLWSDYDGLEIDKSDGFLVLFERPIDAVGCALAYHRSLIELAGEHRIELAGRAGLHLGEVYLRRNSAADVERGAKPIEVEGLAKPLAARVMALAGPCQTLMTRSAFDLARRAAEDRTLEEQVRWMAHGEYALEGIAEPLDVFEAGAEGFAPLAAPPDTPKARRVLGGEAIVLGWRPAAGQPLPGRPHWVMRDKIGEGGSGEVWLAQHAKTDERHVFKFCYEAERLRSLQREVTFFRLMKDALGARDDIVRILDWNFEEAPYYVESEYTEDGDLAQWAANQGGLAAVPLTTRCELVAQVAEALAAAHSVGILHKDVKPANVLITSDPESGPRARLADFGVGGLTDPSELSASGVTLLGLTLNDADGFAGTQLYMAPEVLEGKIPSVQADLYALGVVLYQVVVGDFSRALARGWQRDIADEVLRDDIACYVDGSPSRRPAGAGEIAERLRSLAARRRERLARERAREEAKETREALEKSSQRRRLLAVAVVFLAIFSAAMTFQVRRTRDEARRAEREAAVARRVIDYLEDLFTVTDPDEARGSTVTARELLDRGARGIEEDLTDQPEVQARLMGVMGSVYGNLGLYRAALPLAERSLEKRRLIHGDEHREVALSLHQLGRLRFLMGDYEAAESPLREALSMRRSLLGDTHEDVAETLSEIGNVLVSIGEAEAAELVHRECLKIRRQRFGEPHGKVAEALFNLAIAEHFRDDEAAEALYTEALSMYEAVYGERHPAVGDVLNNYAYLLKDRGDLVGAEPLFRRALALRRQVLGEGHHYVAVAESNLAIVLSATGEFGEAEELARHSTAILVEKFGVEHWQAAVARSVQGASLVGQRRFAEAEPLLVESYGVIRAARGNEFKFARDALERLVALYDAWGRAETATLYRAELAELEAGTRDR